MPDDRPWIERATRSAQRRVAERGPLQNVAMLPPHASLRRYARATFAEVSEIVMLMPPPGAAPDEAGGTARPALPDDPFVVTQRWLESAGLPVPALYDVDEDGDALWLEDLGGDDLDAWGRAHPAALEAKYSDALDLVVKLQAAADAPALVTGRRFDHAILRWELDHYIEWRVEAALGRTLSSAQAEALGEEFDRLATVLAAMPTAVMHRDFQSHNLMVRDDGTLVMLDFQDAMVGPCVYDAVALLRDSYVSLPSDVLERLVSRYASAMADSPLGAHCSEDDVVTWFYTQTLQRKLKDAARFVYIDRVKGNSSFLQYVDGSVAYVRDAFRALSPEWDRLAQLLSEIDPEVTP